MWPKTFRLFAPDIRGSCYCSIQCEVKAGDSDYTCLVSSSKQQQFSEKTRLRAVPFLASVNCGEALDATTEFITLNERLCSRPHYITHEPDDKLHSLPWLPDPKGCLINQRLDMTTISWRNSGQGCPGHILPPTHHYLAIFPAPSPWQPGVNK